MYHHIIVAPDLPEDEEEAVVGGRAVTYFNSPIIGDLIAGINGWDTGGARTAARASKARRPHGKSADQAFTRQELALISRIPPQQ